MSQKEYPGYPEYVVITLPKCGTKTMNKCFTSLGYKGKLGHGRGPYTCLTVFPAVIIGCIFKWHNFQSYSVFDIMQANDFAKEFDDYGKEKIEFAQLAKIWEDNKYEARVS